MKRNNSSNNSSIENLVPIGMIGITVLSGTLLALPSALADDSVVTDVAITVPVACSITSTTDSAHTASVDSGTYKDNIGKTTIKATCNDSQGFSIYAIGYTNEEYGNTVLKPSILDATQYSIITGTATSGATSSWAMKLTAGTGMSSTNILSDTDGTYSNYHKVPTTYTKVATMASVTDATVGASLETTYSAYIAGDQPADIYTGKVKYTMVHPYDNVPADGPQSSTPGCITYHRGANDVVGTMGCQSATDGASLDLLASNFSRTGYGFAGWSDKFDYATNSEAKFYGPQETITVPTGTTANGLSLYAVWIKSQGSIQDQSKVASVCNSLTTAPTDGTANLSSVSALTDQRDNNTYAIAKLADGKCWMIENLRLEAEDTRDASDIALSQGYNTTTFTGLADAESTDFSNSTATNYKNTSTAYYGADGSGAEIIISASDHTYSGTDYSGFFFPRYNNTNTSSRASTPTSNSAVMYSYGNYYTWVAAIADTAFYRTDNQSITNTSLCPTGWRLPQGGNKTRITSNDDNDFWNLTVDALNGDTNPANYDSSTYPYYNGADEATPVANKLRAFPNNFLYSGYFNSSSADYRGRFGYYWSSTAYNNRDSYYLYLGSSYVRPGTSSSGKYNGLSIRCVSSS